MRQVIARDQITIQSAIRANATDADTAEIDAVLALGATNEATFAPHAFFTPIGACHF